MVSCPNVSNNGWSLVSRTGMSVFLWKSKPVIGHLQPSFQYRRIENLMIFFRLTSELNQMHYFVASFISQKYLCLLNPQMPDRVYIYRVTQKMFIKELVLLWIFFIVFLHCPWKVYGGFDYFWIQQKSIKGVLEPKNSPHIKNS